MSWRTQPVLLETLWFEFLLVTPSLLQCPRSDPVLRCHSPPLPGRWNSEDVSRKTSSYLDINIPVVSWVGAPRAEHHLLCWKRVLMLAPQALLCVSVCTRVCTSALLFCWTTGHAGQRFQPPRLAELLSTAGYLHGSLQKQRGCSMAW